MDANKTIEVFDIMADYYGMSEVCNDEIDYCDALFSNGFIYAMENGLIPILGSQTTVGGARMYGESHHLIFDGECYLVDFK